MKIYSVQYLRGLAAILVLIAHAILHPLAREDDKLIRVGGLGVAMFFVISGFIMVLICGDGPFRRFDFYKRRILRVVPMYWIATFGVAAGAILVPAAFRNTEFSIRQLVLSLAFIPHARPNGDISPLLKLGWTLNLEMFFYLCFGLLASFGAGARVAILSALFCVLALIGLRYDFVNPALHSYTQFPLFSFNVGMWVGWATLRGFALPGPAAQWTCLGVSIALFGLTMLIVPGNPYHMWVTICATLASATLLLVGVAAEPRIPSWRALSLIGDASYSLYLVHMFFVGAAVFIVHRVMPDAPLFVTVVIGLISGGSAGIAAHLLLERPIMRLVSAPRRRAPASDAALVVPPDGLSPALMTDESKQ